MLVAPVRLLTSNVRFVVGFFNARLDRLNKVLASARNCSVDPSPSVSTLDATALALASCRVALLVTPPPELLLSPVIITLPLLMFKAPEKLLLFVSSNVPAPILA